MAAEQTASVEAGLATTPPPDAAALPGFYTNPNYVLGDSSATWRFGKPPDYSKTRRLFAESKSFWFLAVPNTEAVLYSLFLTRGGSLHSKGIPRFNRFAVLAAQSSMRHAMESAVNEELVIQSVAVRRVIKA